MPQKHNTLELGSLPLLSSSPLIPASQRNICVLGTMLCRHQERLLKMRHTNAEKQNIYKHTPNIPVHRSAIWQIAIPQRGPTLTFAVTRSNQKSGLVSGNNQKHSNSCYWLAGSVGPSVIGQLWMSRFCDWGECPGHRARLTVPWLPSG